MPTSNPAPTAAVPIGPSSSICQGNNPLLVCALRDGVVAATKATTASNVTSAARVREKNAFSALRSVPASFPDPMLPLFVVPHSSGGFSPVVSTHYVSKKLYSVRSRGVKEFLDDFSGTRK